MKNIKLEEWPAVILRGAALVLIGVHLFTAFFIYQHAIFFITALVLGLLVAREMYQDLAQRFFRLKAEEYEHELQEVRHADQDPNLMIEGARVMKDVPDAEVAPETNKS
ncbi:hypothetical protein [Rhodovulum imhoffii]|nr:hypothetical protein [Rhodovulum imhoffii]